MLVAFAHDIKKTCSAIITHFSTQIRAASQIRHCGWTSQPFGRHDIAPQNCTSETVSFLLSMPSAVKAPLIRAYNHDDRQPHTSITQSKPRSTYSNDRQYPKQNKYKTVVSRCIPVLFITKSGERKPPRTILLIQVTARFQSCHNTRLPTIIEQRLLGEPHLHLDAKFLQIKRDNHPVADSARIAGYNCMLAQQAFCIGNQSIQIFVRLLCKMGHKQNIGTGHHQFCALCSVDLLRHVCARTHPDKHCPKIENTPCNSR